MIMIKVNSHREQRNSWICSFRVLSKILNSDQQTKACATADFLLDGNSVGSFR